MTTQLSVHDIKEILFARLYAYDILRRFFIEEPSQQYLKHFVNQKMVEHFPFVEDSSMIREGVEDVKEYLQQFDIAYKRSHFEDLHWDYTRMMIGPFKLEAPPWESVYVQKDKLLFNKCTLEVRKEYEKFGFELERLNIEAEDHIGLELDFMFHLNQICFQLVEEQGDFVTEDVKMLLKEQEKFLKNHLLKFVSTFSRKMITHAETQFYRGMAKILEGFLQMDSKVLKELLRIEITL